MPSFKKLLQSGSDISQLSDSTGKFVRSAATGSFIKDIHTGSFAKTTDLSDVVRARDTGSFAKTANLSAYVLSSQTGSFLTSLPSGTVSGSSQITYSGISGKPATFPPDSHTHTFASLTSKPTTISGYGITDAFDGTWGSLSGKPSTFAPSSHTHTFASLTSKPTTISGYGITDAFDGTWASLSGKPSTFAPSSHNHDDRYYTETESDARFQPLGSYAAANHSHAYLPLAGGDMSGRITFRTADTNNGFVWVVNSDEAGINFKNTADGDNNSFLNFFTKDNGNEYIKFSHRHYINGGKDLLDIKDGAARFNGNIYVNATQNGDWDLGTNFLSGGDLVWHAGNLTNVSQLTNDAGYITGYTNNYLTGLTFNTSNGVLEATRNGLGAVSVDLDGRYAYASHTHNYDNYSYWTISDGTASEGIYSTNTLTIRGGGATTTSYDSATNTLTINSTDTNTNTTYSAGNGIGLSGTTFSVAAGGGLSQTSTGLAHADTSTASNLSASSRRYVTGLTFDDYGHVTGYTTGTETVVNTDTNTQRTDEEIQDVVGAMVRGGGSTIVSYDDAANTLTIASTDTNTWRGITDTPTNNSSISISAAWARSAFVGASVSNDTITFTKGDGTTTSVTTSDANTNKYLSSLTFDTGSGILTARLNDNTPVTVDLDGRFTDNGYADAMNQHVRTGDSPTFAGMTVNGNLTVTGTTITNNVETVSTTNGVVFEGSVADANELLLLAGGLSADRTIYLPDANGTVALTSQLPTVNNGTLTVQGTGALGGSGTFTANQSGNTTISISHDDTSALSGAYGGSGISSITVDGYGHVTAVGTATYDNYSSWTISDGTASEAIGSGATLTIRGGGASTTSYDAATNTLTISSTDTNTNTTYSAGNGISLSGTTFTVGAGGGLDQTSTGLQHSDTSTVSNLSASGRRYVTGLTFDTYGHVTGYTTGTETVVNTDTNTQRSDEEIQDVVGAMVRGGGATTVAYDDAANTLTISSTDTNTWRPVDDTPRDGQTGVSISSNWAFDNVKTAVPANAVFTDTVYTHPTQTAINASGTGATVVDGVTVNTLGHTTAVSTRTLTLANLGYTGATNANYITNNNQLTNGAGYTTYSANQAVNTTSTPQFSRLGVGQAADSTVPLTVYASGSTVFDVQGSVGQLFSVTDSLTGDIFAVSDISGIPILNVNSNGEVTVDDTLIVSGSITTTSDGDSSTWYSAITNATVSNDTITFTRGNGGTFSVTTSDANTWRGITDTPANDSATSISAKWAQSALTNATVSNDTITFTKGDGTTFSVTTSDSSYAGWSVSDGTNVETVGSGQGVIFSGTGGVTTSYNTTSNTMTIGFPAEPTFTSARMPVLNMSKSGNDSYINFSAQTNDPGYIRHYESNNTARMYFSVSDDNGTTDYFGFGYSGSTERFIIYSNGSFLANGDGRVTGTFRADGDIIAYYSSDERLKENIKPIENASEKIKKIGGYTYDWNDKQTTYEPGTHDMGVIAQEVEEVAPELVTTRDNGFKAVKYEKLVALLIESNKELLARVEALEEQLKNK